MLFYSLCLAYSSFCCLINFSSSFEIQLKHLHMCIIFPVSSPKSLLPAMSIKNLFSPSSALPKFVYISVTVLLNSSDLFTCFLHTRKLLRASLIAQSCLTLCNPMDCSPPGFSVQGIFPGKNTGLGCHFLLQGIFPTQGSNPRLLHWQADSITLSHLSSPYTWIHMLNLTNGTILKCAV